MKKWILIILISAISSTANAKFLAHGYTNYTAAFKASFTQKTFYFKGNTYTVHYRCTPPAGESSVEVEPHLLENIAIFGSERNKIEIIDIINSWCGY